MTEIDVPDWVAAIATEAYSALPARTSFHDSMRAALAAALGAWVVPIGQAGTMPGTAGFTMAVFNVGVAQPIYTLRQEKPE